MMTTHKTDSASDIVNGGWVDRFIPVQLQPYCKLARIDRPIGTWLLLLPCWWGVALASGTLADQQWPELRLLALFATGSLVMRGAGCTWNDLVDRDYDALVARTADRPLPSGAVTVRAAVVFLILQLLLGLAVLLQFNTLTITLGIAAMGLVVAYPFMKRVTYWPQAFLGLTFNWGALVGWTAVKGSLGWPAFLLYAAGFMWTLAYDTIYAHQDKEDDELVGIKSSALKLGAKTKQFLWLFFGAALVLFLLSGIAAGVNWTYALALMGVAISFIWQIIFVDLYDAQDCLAKFRANRLVGLIIFAGLALA